jgi:succinoglycan biosynthesis transport protein ExoP
MTLVIVPLAAVAASLRQSAVYESSADVLLRYQSLPSALSGITDPNSYSYFIDPVRSTDTQLQIAELPLLAGRVDAALRKRGITTDAGGAISVESVTDTDLLRFTAETGDQRTATAIAGEYARQFTRYHKQLDTSSISDAVRGLQARIDTLEAEGTARARTEAADLRSKVDQLQTLLTLQTSNAVVVRVPTGAAKIRPTPRKYGELGIVLGLVLGIGFAFLREAFDTRLRTAEQISGTLKLAQLGRLPAPPRALDKNRQLIMLEQPSSVGADAFRRLRMNLEFASIDKQSQVVMFTSALAQEGKSTTVCNLAVAMALAGKTVAVVDLDLHRPTVSKFFDIGREHPGLTNVVLGDTNIDAALKPVALEGSSGGESAGRRTAGTLFVLPAGVLPPDPGEFVGLEGVGRVIAALRERVEVILLDTPPLLAVGDGLTIARYTDAIVALVRAEQARRPVTGELSTVLSRLPAVKLGFVLAGTSGVDAPGYYGYGYQDYSRPSQTGEFVS